jgi:hypothetical protein
LLKVSVFIGSTTNLFWTNKAFQEDSWSEQACDSSRFLIVCNFQMLKKVKFLMKIVPLTICCRELGMAIVPYSPLGYGFFAGYKLTDAQEGDMRGVCVWFSTWPIHHALTWLHFITIDWNSFFKLFLLFSAPLQCRAFG